MTTVILSKDDGLVCSLPATSVIAILSAALDSTREDRPHLRSVLVSNFRGDTRPGLGHTASEAADEVEKAWPEAIPPAWIKLSSGGDFTHIMPGLIRGFEQLSATLMRVDFERPDRRIASGLIDNTPENMQQLQAALKGENNVEQSHA